jgi:hypothetical protein
LHFLKLISAPQLKAPVIIVAVLSVIVVEVGIIMSGGIAKADKILPEIWEQANLEIIVSASADFTSG